MTCHMQTTGTHVRFNDIFRIFRFMVILMGEQKKKKTELLQCDIWTIVYMTVN